MSLLDCFLQIDSSRFVDGGSFFRDWAEYIIGIPAFLISTIVAIWIYKKQISKKSLSYLLNEKIRLVNINSSFKNRFKIIFDDNEIVNLTLYKIEFINTGRIPILKTDFESHIEINLVAPVNSSIKILSSDIVDRKPENIACILQKAENRILISPSLLNSGDRFSIQILCDINEQDDISIKIDARIAGVKSLEQIKSSKNDISSVWIEFAMRLAVFVIWLGFLYFLAKLFLNTGIIDFIKRIFS